MRAKNITLSQKLVQKKTKNLLYFFRKQEIVDARQIFFKKNFIFSHFYIFAFFIFF